MKFDEKTALIVCAVQDHVKQIERQSLSQPDFMKSLSDVLALWRNRDWGVFHLKDLRTPSNFAFETAPVGAEQFYDCETGQGFLKTPLGSMLRMGGCERVVLGGCFLSGMVFHTAVHAQALGFETFILRDTSPALKQAEIAANTMDDVFSAQAREEGVGLLSMAEFFGAL